MQVIRWEPFREMDDFFRSFSPLFNRWNPALGEDGQQQQWLPAVDIRETEAEYQVCAELPGLRREDVKVRLENNVLTIEGERRQEKDVDDERSHRTERMYGRFCRRFTLPEDADPDAIRAESKDGVLQVHIPKREVERQKPVEIPVQ